MRWGETADWLSAAAAECGHPEPPELAGFPDLRDDNQPVWVAFQFLGRRRAVIQGAMASGPARISLADINAYVARFGPDDPDEYRFLLRALFAMDGTYLAWVEQQRASKAHPPDTQA